MRFIEFLKQLFVKTATLYTFHFIASDNTRIVESKTKELLQQ